MSTRNPIASAVTRHHPFGDVARGVSVFAVQQGVSAVDALEYALCLLSTVSASVKMVADAADHEDDQKINWSTYYLLESVEALLSASISGLREVK